MRVNIVFPQDVKAAAVTEVWARFMGLLAPFFEKEEIKLQVLFLSETGQIPGEFGGFGEVTCAHVEKEMLPGSICGYLNRYFQNHPADLNVFAPTQEGKNLGKLCAALNDWDCHGDVIALSSDASDVISMKIKRKVYSAHKEAIFGLIPTKNIIIPTAGGEKKENPFSEPFVLLNVEEWREEENRGGQLLQKLPKIITDNLAGAKLVFVGGRGLKSKENYLRLKELTKKCGAVCGCTRPVALSGWEDYSKVIGISGSSLTADICVTFGVSGSAPFLFGMENVKHLIAINKDPDAPVFSYAEYGIVEDCMRIMEAMLAE